MNPLIENISWLKTKVQKDLFPYLQGYFSDPMTRGTKRGQIFIRDINVNIEDLTLIASRIGAEYTVC